MYCAHCFRKIERTDGVFCNIHIGLWDSLNEKTKNQIGEKLKDKIPKRKLQIFINKIMILDDLNKVFHCTNKEDV